MNNEKAKSSESKQNNIINIVITGDVSGSNLIVGDHNQTSRGNIGTATSNSAVSLNGIPAGSYLPFARNVLFTDRKRDLDALADILLKDSPTATVISQTITGMGGIGKTQLAVEFAWLYGHHFKGVHWLDLRDPQGLDGAIALCGTKMGYTYKDQRKLVAKTLKTWIEDRPRLLILDNLEDVTKANEVLARFEHPSIKILVTSRRIDFPKSGGFHIQSINLFNEEESLEFLAKKFEHSETPAARTALAERLGYLPLALELAANYINIRKISIESYLQELTDIKKLDNKQTIWSKDLDVTSPTNHDQSLFKTFHLSWLDLKDEIEQKMFIIAGYCAPNIPIPSEIFKRTLNLDDDLLPKALHRLKTLGLLQVSNDLQSSIHTLLSAFARSLEIPDKDNILGKLTYELAHLAKQANDKVDETGNLQWFAPLLVHVSSVAEFAEKDFSSDATNLLRNLGYYLHTIADFNRAKIAYEHALEIDQNNFESGHQKIIKDRNNLAEVMIDLGDLTGAKIFVEHTLEIVKQKQQSDDPNMAKALSNLGYILQDMGDLDSAKDAFENALIIDKATFPPDHQYVTRDLNNVGMLLKDLGVLVKARAIIEEALMIDETARGPKHPTVARDLNNLGRILRDIGALNSAKECAERAIKIDKEVFGPNHPNVARDYQYLGLILGNMGNYEDAKVILNLSLQIFKDFFPENHRKIKDIQYGLESISN